MALAASLRALMLTTVAGAAFLPAAAQAQSIWGGPGSTTTLSSYNLQTNWSNNAPPLTAGQSAVFANTGNTTVTVIAGPASPDSWTFTANSQSYTVSGADVNFGGTGLVNNANSGQSISVANNIDGAGSVNQAGNSLLTLSGSNSYTGGTTISAGVLRIGNASALGNTSSNTTTITGGTLDLGAFTTVRQSELDQSGGTVQNGTIAVSIYQLTGGTLALNGTANVGTASILQAGIVDGLLTGSGMLAKTTAATVTLNNANTYTGGTSLSAGQLTLGNAAALGNTANATSISGGVLDLGAFTSVQQAEIEQTAGTIQNGTISVSHYFLNGGTVAANATANVATIFDFRAGTVDGVLAGSGSMTKTTDGILTLNGMNTYTGTTSVSAGTLQGVGSVNALTVSGGTFAPGNGTAGSSMTVTGGLSLQSAAIFAVQVNPTTASFANVIGNASLGGATVSATFAPGSYAAKRYTIVKATGTVSGTFNPIVAKAPSNFVTTLSYDNHDAYLNLKLDFGASGGLNINQQNVGNALTNYFNTVGTVPIVFASLTPGGLTQASGESATGIQQTTFNAMSQFVGVLTDPVGAGRGGNISGATPFTEEFDAANAYAANDPARSQRERDAYAAIYRKAPAMTAPFVPGWSAWAAGFGGSQSTNGNATLGSNDTTSRIGAVAVGADYRISPNTIAGFALAGGGTSFSVNGLGSGRSDLFQAGGYVRHSNGPAYIAAAAAYGWQDITTDRTVTIAGADHLRAEFNANAYSGRLEGGYRFVAPVANGIGIAPYAAGQFVSVDLPAYAESAVSGVNTFALVYGAKSVTDSRSEFGVRTDKSLALESGVLTLRGRLAWAHDFNSNRTVAATFQALPGASFVVNGAAQSADKALTTASAEVKLSNDVSLAATFEGEFSGNSSSYAGKGVVRYQW